MLFAKVFGISTANLSATATAVQDFARHGGGAIPITLDKKWPTHGAANHLKCSYDAR
jgi:hypothetical protein